MLLSLSIQNFALIEKAQLDFLEGFSVLSGETGAGKSILIEALSLLVGEKASADIVRVGTKEALVEGVFKVSPELKERLDSMGLDDGDDLIIRRHVPMEGRSKIFANGKNITLSQLQEMGSLLIDISGQHENQVLLNRKNYISILNRTALSFGGEGKAADYAKVFEVYQDAYQAYQSQKRELDKLYQLVREKNDKFEFLKFQSAELEKAGEILPGEEDELIAEKKRIKNAEALNKLVGSASSLSGRHEGALGQWIEAQKNISKAAQMDESLSPLVLRMEEQIGVLSEIVDDIDIYGGKILVNPKRLDIIESRLYLLFELKRKFGPTLYDVIARQADVKAQLGSMENSDEAILKLETSIKELAKILMEKAAALTVERKKLAKKFEKEIELELKDLAMPQVRFEIKFEARAMDVSLCTPEGWDDLHFLLAANPGSPLKPLSQVASGGELSRILLAIKKVLTSSSKTVTFIFDEIDTGIGGQVASSVGLKLKEIARGSQVLVVTHLPQVATMADHHFSIEKQFSHTSSKTIIRRLDGGSEREEEVARMLGGLQITDKTRAHARDMLKAVKSIDLK